MMFKIDIIHKIVEDIESLNGYEAVDDGIGDMDGEVIITTPWKSHSGKIKYNFIWDTITMEFYWLNGMKFRINFKKDQIYIIDEFRYRVVCLLDTVKRTWLKQSFPGTKAFIRVDYQYTNSRRTEKLVPILRACLLDDKRLNWKPIDDSSFLFVSENHENERDLRTYLVRTIVDRVEQQCDVKYVLNLFLKLENIQ